MYFPLGTVTACIGRAVSPIGRIVQKCQWTMGWGGEVLRRKRKKKVETLNRTTFTFPPPGSPRCQLQLPLAPPV